MDVLAVNYEWPNTTSNCGGGGRIGKQLVDGLRERGHNVTVVTDDADGHYATFPARRFGAIGDAIDRHDPDVVHGQFAVPSSLPLAVLAAGRDLPLVVSVMGADIYDPTRYQRLRRLLRPVVRWVLSVADRVVAPSRDMRARVQGGFPVDPDVVHYGIPPGRYAWRSRTPDGAPALLSVCRLVERKHLRAAIRAVEQLRAGGIDATYTIVGEGPRGDALRELAADRDWLSVPGYADDLQPVYDDADLFVLPSLHEAFGIVCLEALAAGLPVVTTQTGGQTDVVGSAVGAIASTTRSGTDPPAATADALADAITDAIERYDTIQANTQGYVRREFSRERMVDAYDRTFQAVTN